jgi:hypothetical protein
MPPRVSWAIALVLLSSPDRYFYYHDGHPSIAVRRIVAHEVKREFIEAFR